MADPAAGQGLPAAEPRQGAADGGPAVDAAVTGDTAMHDLAAGLPDELDIEGCERRSNLHGACAT